MFPYIPLKICVYICLVEITFDLLPLTYDHFKLQLHAFYDIVQETKILRKWVWFLFPSDFQCLLLLQVYIWLALHKSPNFIASGTQGRTLTGGLHSEVSERKVPTFVLLSPCMLCPLPLLLPSMLFSPISFLITFQRNSWL